MRIKEWKNYNLTSEGFWIGIQDEDAYGNWEVNPITQPRSDASSEIVGVTLSDRTIACQFAYHGGLMPLESAWHLFMERIKPLRTGLGKLVMTRNDGGGDWECNAMLVAAGRVVDDEGKNVYRVTWFSTEQLWSDQSISSAAGVLVPATITNASFPANVTGWTKSANPSGITAALTWDNSVYFESIGSADINVSGNSAGGTETLIFTSDQQFPCEAGQRISVRARLRTTNSHASNPGPWVDPRTLLQFYDASHVLLDSVVSSLPNDDSFGLGGYMDPNVWFFATAPTTAEGAIPAEAPAGTSYCKIGAEITIGAGQTGTVNLDKFEFVSPPPGTVTPFTVDGHGPTHLTITATPAGDFPQRIMAHTFSITNNGDQPLINRARQVDLGDQSAVGIAGSYWSLIKDGALVRSSISDYDSKKAIMWFTIDHLPPGETADYTLLVSDQTLLAGSTFNTYTAPAFDIGFAYATVGSSSSATVTNIPTGLGTEVDRWIGGRMEVLTGTYATEVVDITDSGTTSVTHDALPGALSNGDLVLIHMSSNERWTYAVRQTERGHPRGGWWIDKGQTRPGDYRYDVPGGLIPHLYWNNRDHFAQSWYTAVDPLGGTSYDYFALLDADRTWRGGSTFKDQGGYDGIMLASPVDIEQLKIDFKLKNPNKMCQFVVGSRPAAGAMEFNHNYANNDASTTLTDKSIQTIGFDAGTRAVYMGIGPNYGDEIDPLWAGYEGQCTSVPSSTTLVDNTQDGVWVDDMYNGATITITSGAGAGQSKTITDTAANGTITTSAWGTALDTTSRFRIRNKKNVSTVRNHTTMEFEFDDSTIEQSAVSAATDAYILYRDILIDANDSGDPYQRVAIHPEVTRRYIVLLADESLVIDGTLMKAWIADSSSGDYIRLVPPQAYVVYDIEANGTQRLASKWLLVEPGEHEITLDADESGIECTVDAEWVESVYA